MTRTQLVLDLPAPEAIRVVVVDDEAIVNTCLAMVVRRLGALATSAPATEVGRVFDAATPRAHVDEVAGQADEVFAVVQRPGKLGQKRPASFQMLLARSTDAVELALTLMGPDAQSS